MDANNLKLTHVAGTFLIQADGAFLNGAGLGEGEDRNITIPKTFRDLRGEKPYVSAQAWKRWLRNTAAEEAGWPVSEPQAIGWNPRGNVNKIASQLNPVDFPEDDIFGYMHAQEGQGRRRDAEIDDGDEEEQTQDRKVRAVMRASPFAASLLVSLRSVGWRGDDEGFVHLTKYDRMALGGAEVGRFLAAISSRAQKGQVKDVWRRLEDFDKVLASQVMSAAEAGDLGQLRDLLRARAASEGKEEEVKFIENATSPLPYSTRFYNTNLQGVFCLNYARLGVYWNIGDRVELGEEKVRESLRDLKIEDVTAKAPYNTLTENGRAGRVYRLINADESRRERATALLQALAVLRGGAKQAQFGTDVAPKVLILAGLTGGNPIFNHLFEDRNDGPVLKVETLKEVLRDYADRIVTPVLIGIRAGYLGNESDVRSLSGWYRVEKSDANYSATTLRGPVQRTGESGTWIEVQVMTPLDAARGIGNHLP